MMLAILGIYVSCFILHVLLPGRRTIGYVCDRDGKALKYKLNGFVMWIISFATFLIFPMTIQTQLYDNFAGNALEALVIGLAVSFFFYIRGGNEKYARCRTIDQVNSKIEPALAGEAPSKLAKFYLGHEWNPRIFGVDVKMYLYAVGAITLQLNILSFCAADRLRRGHLSFAAGTYLAMFSWFIAEYMFFENVHLYTYDLFAEKIGFKLCWGCLFFYPFFYGIGGLSLAWQESRTDISFPISICCLFLFFCGWIITRGANLQKYYFRVNPANKTFTFGPFTVDQRCVPGTHILCSGWWGAAKHFNYTGEILQGLAISLPAVLISNSLASAVVPLAYPVFYCALFIPRQIDDDALCQQKYGEKWNKYSEIVTYRMIPGIY